MLGVCCDGESVAELAAHFGRNAGFPQVDLAVAVDQAEGGIGGGERNRVAARLHVLDRVVAERQGSAEPLAVAIESHQRLLPDVLDFNLIHATGNEMGAVAGPGDLGKIAVVDTLDIRIEAEPQLRRS